MLLPPHEAHLFFKLHRTLMFFVNQRLQVLPDAIDTPEAVLPSGSRLKVRNALLDDLDLIESFVNENPAGLSDSELEIVLSWRHLVDGTFYVFRKLTKYTVFLSSEPQPVAYGVTALTEPFEEMVGPYLPVMVDTVLLPFKNQVIYDGLLAGLGPTLTFGGGIRRMLNQSYQEAKARHGIVTTLPMSARTIAPKNKSSPKKTPTTEDMQGVLGLIVNMTDQFCRDHLNEEYAELCRQLTEKLARKRPSPLLSGKPNTWACGIVRTIGWVNFLDDHSQKPHMKLTTIDKAFGVGESTGQGKSKQIRRLLKIHQFGFEWTLPSRYEENDAGWILKVDGFPVDIRHCSREAQEIAFEKGMIPYIPADRAAES